MMSVTDMRKDPTAREKAADLARQWARRAVTAMAEASGGTTVTRPMFRGRPDLGSTVTDVEPIAALQAATSLNHAARRLAVEYVRQAREANDSWHDIGVAHPDEKLTVDEVCLELKISRSTFYEWRQKRRGPRCIRLPNGALRVRRRDFDDWLAGQEVA